MLKPDISIPTVYKTTRQYHSAKSLLGQARLVSCSIHRPQPAPDLSDLKSSFQERLGPRLTTLSLSIDFYALERLANPRLALGESTAISRTV